MTARAQSRPIDRALANVWAKAIYADAAFVGRVHRGEASWLAESASGRLIGSYKTEKGAVAAVLDKARRR